ncbi:MAG: nitrous oxide reductase family maturation protein NosD [Promethearchaeota archaeon]
MKIKKIFEKRRVKTLSFLIILFSVSISLLTYGFFQNNLKLVDTSNSFKEDFTELKSSTVVSPIYIDDTVPGSDWAWAVTQAWCTGSGSPGDPYLLQNLEIDCGGADNGIVIENSVAYFTIRDCTIYNSGSGYYGIYLYNVNNGKIIGNNCSNNSLGIWIEYSSHNSIEGNTIYSDGTGTGIVLYYSCNYNTIDGNFVENGYHGIGCIESDSNTISGNTLIKSINFGIWFLSDCDFNNISGNIVSDNTDPTDIGAEGISIESGSDNNIITGNTVNNNAENGIYIESSDFNNITANVIYSNNESGITLDGACYTITICDNEIYENEMNGINFANSGDDKCYGNVIRDNSGTGIYVSSLSGDMLFYENFFHRNGKHAIDNGLNNDWNSTLIGNYWDNYTGSDTSPKDGIGDVPHDFGTGIDYLPIVDNANPIVTINSPNPDDAFDDAPSFSLTINEDYLFYMWYTLDGGVKNYFTDFTGIIDQTAWDALPDGNITLTFYANDKAENVGSAEVNVSKDTQAPIIVINKPTSDKKISSNFGFELDITEPHLDTIWYSLDGGVTNFTAETPTEKITKAAWATAAKGEVTVTFYASDTLGHIGSESVTIRKVSPTIGLDYVTTSILILAISGIVIIAIISKIHSKKRIISN